MAKWNIFNFMEKKIDAAEISPVTEKLLEQIALKELALYIGISYIANTMSKCEFKTFKGGKEVHEELYYKLNVSPNPNQNSSQFINKFVEKYYYNGAALVVPHKNHIYCADDFSLKDTSNPLKEDVFINVTFGTHVPNKEYKAKDVFHFKLDDKNVKSLIDSLYMQYSELIATAFEAYKKTNGTKYKLLIEQYAAGDPKFQKLYDESLKKQLQDFLQSNKGVYPQFKGIDLQEFTKTNGKDTDDIVALRKEIFETTAQALKIPQSMMYGNITNMNEIVKVYLSFCIDPLADMISEELTRKYYTYAEWKAGDYIKVDTSCINHVDILEVSQAVYNALGSGVPTIDDLRERLGMEALNTPFSQQHFLSKNFVPIEDTLNGTAEKGGE